MRIDLATLYSTQGSAQSSVADSTAVTAPRTSEPAFRTPENSGYMHIAYSVAAVIYGSYLMLLRGRWSALKNRQNRSATSRR